MLAPSQVENVLGESNSSSEIIIPPPDIRSMVDKVARFVASYRPRLEKFLAKNVGMRRYSFLDGADPYHAYYKQQLTELRAQNGSANEKTWPRPMTDKNAAVIESILKSHESSSASYVVCDTVLVSPLTGELVTYSAMFEHMQDPKYKEEKERLFAKIREATLAQDDVISRSIISVARKCPHILGTTVEEVCDAVKAAIEWTYPAFSKRRRTFDSWLVPEDEFLSQHPGPACISVWVPVKGQMVEIGVESLSESVSSLKEKIAVQVEEAPSADKLNLRGKAGFLTDCLSLAYYNVAGGAMLYLSWW